MPPAIIGGAIAAAGAVGGAVIAGSAADRASAAASDAAAANNQLQRDVYQKNTANISPFMERGNVAGNYYNALLGLPSATVSPATGEGPGGAPFTVSGIGADGMPTITATPPQTSAPATTPVDAQNAFNVFRNSDGYQFRMGEGEKALNTGYAAKGLIQSGAAMKGINAFAQGVASDEFGKYIGYLGNQQAVGLSGANALAGVGSGYANAVSSNNNSAASATGNAAIAGANGINSAIGQGINALGAFAGRQSSYGGGGNAFAPSYGGAR